LEIRDACLYLAQFTAIIESMAALVEPTFDLLCRLWGKARPPEGSDGPTYHPLVCHSLDVAAVGKVLLECWPQLRRHLSGLLGVEEPEAAQLLVHLLILHDIGKFARGFQAKVPGLFVSESFGSIDQVVTQFDHASGGFYLLKDLMALRSGLPEWTAMSPLIAAVMGHHGSPPRSSNEFGLTNMLPGNSRGVVQLFVDEVNRLLPPPPVKLDGRRIVKASFVVAGFAVLCDWLGSNEQWFKYTDRTSFSSLANYWSEIALKQAGKAVSGAGVLPARSAPARPFAELTHSTFKPNPLQEWAERVALPDGPLLFILEDETGSGKTEAALMLAHRLISEGRAEGLYVALPTMATANAMFGRLAVLYRNLFADGETPSIALVHGRREMVKGFREAVLAAGRREKPFGMDNSDETASSACAEWIADDRRRSFLADAGAGTIDQAALAILPTRYQSLRLFGLGSKILVIDEVHAYDDYVQSLVCGLLAFQGALGGSAILLSATLPAGTRADLVRAFAHAADGPEEDDPSECYPRATLWSREAGSRAFPIDGREDRARNLPVRILNSVAAAYDIVAAAATKGLAVLYLRNTVGDAFAAFREMQKRGINAMLFHSRFALGDRLDVEDQVREKFGRESKPAERECVLVATQVAEQSLDIDFDLVVTDLAPIDLIIQRAGRLWRHERSGREGAPELFVVSPDSVDDPPADWYSAMFKGASYVYSHPGRLWQTARLLQREGAIRSPGGLRALVEGVYGDAAEVLPETLGAKSYDTEGREGANRNQGQANVLKLSKGYDRGGAPWDVEERTPTRLVDQPQATLRLARIENGRVVPWHSGVEHQVWRAWTLSEVNIAANRVKGEAIPPEFKVAAEAARRDWTRYDSAKLMVIMRPNRDSWTGHAMTGKDRVIELFYSPQFGLADRAPEPKA
jgi:CRISPR-associated endonuclease/helicase Cas3